MYDPDFCFKVILPAHVIPFGSDVTKVRGEKVYVLVDKVTVYGEKGEPRSIEALDGSRFLANKSGNMNVVSNDTELIWLVPKWQLIAFLSDDYEK